MHAGQQYVPLLDLPVPDSEQQLPTGGRAP